MTEGSARPPSWSRDLPTPASALVIVAHPDDAELQAGGTLAKWAAAGCVVYHLVCTDGSKGTWDPHADTLHLIAVRRDEQRAAAAALGATGQQVFLTHTDGELSADLDVRGQVCAVIREFQPQVVLGHDPWKRYRLHPDHRAAGFLAVEGIVAARDPHFHPEQGLAPHRPSMLLLFEADEPNHIETLSEGDIAVKLRSLECHTSQLESTMRIGADDDGTQRAAFHERIRATAMRHGRPLDVTFAEQFHVIRDL
jgi:LmbE family N-acetylglucosaminyl deacetylase